MSGDKSRAISSAVDAGQSRSSSRQSSTAYYDDTARATPSASSKTTQFFSEHTHEIIYVSVGVAALAAGAYFLYRRYASK